MTFGGKEGHPNIQPLARLGIQLGTSGLGGRDLIKDHCANPSATSNEDSHSILNITYKDFSGTFATFYG